MIIDHKAVLRTALSLFLPAPAGERGLPPRDPNIKAPPPPPRQVFRCAACGDVHDIESLCEDDMCEHCCDDEPGWME